MDNNNLPFSSAINQLFSYYIMLSVFGYGYLVTIKL
jgi:hypothetical protein